MLNLKLKSRKGKSFNKILKKIKIFIEIDNIN
jgi:hypothetical protein